MNLPKTNFQVRRDVFQFNQRRKRSKEFLLSLKCRQKKEKKLFGEGEFFIENDKRNNKIKLTKTIYLNIKNGQTFYHFCHSLPPNLCYLIRSLAKIQTQIFQSLQLSRRSH